MGVFHGSAQAQGTTERQDAYLVTLHNANPTLGRGAKPPQAADVARAGLESGDPQSLDPNKAMKPMAVWESATPARKRRAQRSDKMLTW